MLVIVFEWSKGAEHNWAIKSTWTLAVIMGAIKLQTMVALWNDTDDYKYELWVFVGVYVLIVIIAILALFFGVLPEEFVPPTSDYAPLSARREAEKAIYGALPKVLSSSPSQAAFARILLDDDDALISINNRPSTCEP